MRATWLGLSSATSQPTFSLISLAMTMPSAQTSMATLSDGSSFLYRDSLPALFVRPFVPLTFPSVPIILIS